MKTADLLIDCLENWVGVKSHKFIIDNYNKQVPLPRGYRVRYDDQWCATGLSAAILACEMEDLIGTECSCGQFIEIFKRKNIWIEDGSITPKRGDIILYNWDDRTQPNDGWAEHIGVVTKVYDGKMCVIECNYKGSVGYRTIQVGWGYIRGYARPNYDKNLRSDEEIAKEVIHGLWGNGMERRIALAKAGYDYQKVQSIVNRMLRG